MPTHAAVDAAAVAAVRGVELAVLKKLRGARAGLRDLGRDRLPGSAADLAPVGDRARTCRCRELVERQRSGRGVRRGRCSTTAITTVSRANGNACRPAVSLGGARAAPEERAKSTSGSCPGRTACSCRRRSPFGRVTSAPPGPAAAAPAGVPPPGRGEGRDVEGLPVGVRAPAFQASASSLSACWEVSEPTPTRSVAVIGVVVLSSRSGRVRRRGRARGHDERGPGDRGRESDREGLACRHLKVHFL